MTACFGYFLMLTLASARRVIVSLGAKVVLVGDAAIGKTRLFQALTSMDDGGNFVAAQSTFHNYTNTTFNNQDVEWAGHPVEIWDTGGGDKLYQLRQMSIFEADLVLLCFNLMSPLSLNNIQYQWLEEIAYAFGKGISNTDEDKLCYRGTEKAACLQHSECSWMECKIANCPKKMEGCIDRASEEKEACSADGYGPVLGLQCTPGHTSAKKHPPVKKTVKAPKMPKMMLIGLKPSISVRAHPKSDKINKEELMKRMKQSFPELKYFRVNLAIDREAQKDDEMIVTGLQPEASDALHYARTMAKNNQWPLYIVDTKNNHPYGIIGKESVTMKQLQQAILAQVELSDSVDEASRTQKIDLRKSSDVVPLRSPAQKIDLRKSTDVPLHLPAKKIDLRQSTEHY